MTDQYRATAPVDHDEGPAILGVIREEIAQLTRRIPELELERSELSVEAGRLDSECVLAKIAGEAPSGKQQKQLQDNERSLSLIDEAVRVAKARLAELADIEIAEIQVQRWREHANELVAAADGVTAIIEHLNQAIRIVENSTTGERRANLLADIGSALHRAFHDSNSGRTGCVDAKLSEAAVSYRKSARQRLIGLPAAAEKLPPLERDTPIYARKSFRYTDCGDRGIAHQGIIAGALVQVPKVVADAAVRAGAAEIVQTKHVRVKLKLAFTQEDERGRRTWPAGFTGNVAYTTAKEMAQAGAVDEETVHFAVTEVDVKELRAKFPELLGTNEVDLGAFNERRIDGERALAELADRPTVEVPKLEGRTRSLAQLTP